MALQSNYPEHGPHVSAPIVVLFAGDPADLAVPDDEFAARSNVEVVCAIDCRTALGHLDDVDCVVSVATLPDGDWLDLLIAIRRRAPTLPFVLTTTEPLSAVADELYAREHTDYVEKDPTTTGARLLEQRIRRLIVERRQAAVARRAAAAIDASRDPILIVDANGQIANANWRLASVLGPERTSLQGRDWTTLFTDDAVTDLRTDAIPMGAEGWNWTGPTALETSDGEVINARTELVRLEDGSMIFTFYDLDRQADCG